MKKIISLSILASLAMGSAFAAPSKQDIQEQFRKVDPSGSIDSITETPIDGLYEVKAGAKVLYTDSNGKYMLYGHLIDLRGSQPVSLTENAMKGARLNAIHQLDPSSMIVFNPTNGKKPKQEITVFTDIDCGYCRKLHREVPALNEAGIAVRYIAFPRTGINSPSFYKAANVWCAQNPQQAMNDAKSGQEVPSTGKCDKSDVIKQHLNLVRDLELSGTPAIVLQDGTLIPGYLPAAQLISRVRVASEANAGDEAVKQG